jgi:hypothetical protein
MDNYKKAIELLQKVVSIINIDSDKATDGECIELIFDLEIQEFLNKLENA